MPSATATRTVRTTIILGRYTTPQGVRTLYARHKDGATLITDEPAAGHGKFYLVDTIPDADGTLAIDALAELYLEEARQLCAPPMAHTVLDPDLKAEE